MLTEITQFRDPALGKSQLAEIMQHVNAGKYFDNPVPEWLNTHKISGPALVFDIELIEQRMQWLGELTKPLSITPLVAVKSCPDAEYLGVGNSHLGGFDVSNLAEYLCLPDDLEGKLVSVTGPDPGNDFGGFTARGNTAVIALDSLTQLENYFSQRPSMPYVLRIQGSDLLKSLNPPDPGYYPTTRFGFTTDEVGQLLRDPRIRANPPAGFHVHHGSERNQASTYMAIIEGLRQLAGQLQAQPGYINLGGGWHSTDREEMAEVLQAARKAFPLPCSILLEPGRWYAEGAGFAVGTIVNQTQAQGQVRYTVNLSGRCHLHWSDVKLLCPIEANAGRFFDAQFFGPSCYEADRVGRFLLPFRDDFYRESGLFSGRQVIFSGVSTYSAAWNTSFNGIPRADVIWYRG